MDSSYVCSVKPKVMQVYVYLGVLRRNAEVRQDKGVVWGRASVREMTEGYEVCEEKKAQARHVLVRSTAEEERTDWFGLG